MHCENPANVIRVGIPIVQENYIDYVMGMERLMYDNGVDIVFGAHEHSYERHWPVFDQKVRVAFQLIGKFIVLSERPHFL